MLTVLCWLLWRWPHVPLCISFLKRYFSFFSAAVSAEMWRQIQFRRRAQRPCDPFRQDWDTALFCRPVLWLRLRGSARDERDHRYRLAACFEMMDQVKYFQFNPLTDTLPHSWFSTRHERRCNDLKLPRLASYTCKCGSKQHIPSIWMKYSLRVIQARNLPELLRVC